MFAGGFCNRSTISAWASGSNPICGFSDKIWNQARRISFKAFRKSQVIQRGDVIHIDCGLNYMGLSTDWQKMGYVLRTGEKDAPEGLKKALANTNRLQDALFTHIKPGAKGFEVYEATMADMKTAGIEA